MRVKDCINFQGKSGPWFVTGEFVGWVQELGICFVCKKCVKNCSMFQSPKKKKQYLVSNYDRTVSSNCMYTHICPMTSIQHEEEERSGSHSCECRVACDTSSDISHFLTLPHEPAQPRVRCSENCGPNSPEQAKLNHKPRKQAVLPSA